MFVAHHPSLRAKAIEWRISENLTIDELAERLGLPRTTIYSWVNHIPIAREYRASPAQRKGNRNMQRAWARKREAAYEEGRSMFADLVREPTFRDFVCMYIGEGYKRNRNRVSIANSDPAVIALGARWIRRFASNRVDFMVQYHADQDLDEVRRFWGDLLDVAPEQIKLQRKSNSNGLAGRKWRCRHGVLSVGSNDTYFRARLQSWIDLIRTEWTVESPEVGA